MFVRSTLVSVYDQRGKKRPEPLVTEVDHPCTCNASQNVSEEACWACRNGAHRRVRL